MASQKLKAVPEPSPLEAAVDAARQEFAEATRQVAGAEAAKAALAQEIDALRRRQTQAQEAAQEAERAERDALAGLAAAGRGPYEAARAQAQSLARQIAEQGEELARMEAARQGAVEAIGAARTRAGMAKHRLWGAVAALERADLADAALLHKVRRAWLAQQRAGTAVGAYTTYAGFLAAVFPPPPLKDNDPLYQEMTCEYVPEAAQ